MNKKQMAAAFNEWMRRYIADPAGFEAEFQAVEQFKKDVRRKRPAGYGEQCAAYMGKLNKELARAGRAAK